MKLSLFFASCSLIFHIAFSASHGDSVLQQVRHSYSLEEEVAIRADEGEGGMAAVPKAPSSARAKLDMEHGGYANFMQRTPYLLFEW